MPEAEKRVLLVDDEPDLREIISAILVEDGYEVVSAVNGQDALDKFQKQAFHFVITDAHMPIMSGIEFFKRAMSLRQTPFILTSGFSDLIDIDSAYKMGAREFLQKPFLNDDLVSTVQFVESEIRKGSTYMADGSPINYCAIPVDDFSKGSQLRGDVYLKINNDKYVLLERHESPLSAERVEGYRKKGVEYFYVQNLFFSELVEFDPTSLNAKSTKPATSRHRKFAMLQQSLGEVLTEVTVEGISFKTIERAKNCLTTALSLIIDSKDLFSLLDQLKLSRDRTFAHSIGVSLYAIAIAQNWGINDVSTLFKVAMAGLFHDIGKKELPIELLEKPINEMTETELALYRTHVARGHSLLARIPGIPEEVLQAVVEHHETIRGTGFPKGLKSEEIHPISRIVTVANEFCDLALLQGAVGLDPKSALERLYQTKKEDVDMIALRLLMKLFGQVVS